MQNNTFGISTESLRFETPRVKKNGFYESGMLKLWYTMVHVYKTHARREIQINISSNTSKFNIFHK